MMKLLKERKKERKKESGNAQESILIAPTEKKVAGQSVQ